VVPRSSARATSTANPEALALTQGRGPSSRLRLQQHERDTGLHHWLRRTSQGGVSNITTSLRQGDARFELHPALHYYNSLTKSSLFLLRSLASLTIKRIRKGAGVAIVIIGSKGDTARSIPFSVLLKLLGFSVFYWFHTDLEVLAGSRFYPVARAVWKKAGSAHVFLSPRLAQSATDAHRFPPERCHVIPNGIDHIGRRDPQLLIANERWTPCSWAGGHPRKELPIWSNSSRLHASASVTAAIFSAIRGQATDRPTTRISNSTGGVTRRKSKKPSEAQES
jgi:hypothetical protein